MKKKQKLFLGFTVLVITAIFTMAGCQLEEEVKFPSEFIGTWERAFTSPYTSTLTFSSKNVKASNQKITETVHGKENKGLDKSIKIRDIY